MMQWKKGDSGFEVKDNLNVEIETDERSGPGALFDQVIHSLATALTRVGVSSLMLLVMIAVVVATVLFGLSADDAMAFGQWCKRC
jgi:hypothetical protein